MATTALAPASPRWQAPPPEDESDFADEPRRGFDLRVTLAAARRRMWWIVAILVLSAAVGVIADNTELNAGDVEANVFKAPAG